MPRFWAYIGDKVQGPLDVPSLSKVTGFNLLTQVCEEGAQSWRMADEVIEIKSYLLAPPRPNSFALDFGNAAPKLEAPPPVPSDEEMTLPDQDTSWQEPKKLATPEGKMDAVMAMGSPVTSGAAVGPAAALRSICETCGYKNPRDVKLCMKCGTLLSGAASQGPAQPIELAVATHEPPPVRIETPVVQTQIPVESPTSTGTTIEISIPKLVGLVASVAVLIGGSVFGVKVWKKNHRPKPAALASVAATPSVKKPHKMKAVSAPRKVAKVIPTAASDAEGTEDEDRPTPISQSKSPSSRHREEALEPKPSEEVPYHVVAEATPLKNRNSAPLNSPYTTKRRNEKTLWNSQEEQALRQVQRNRVYGGQRTIERNAEILMQILRDREYSAAFETGKRIYLYNDIDWGATMVNGPVYEVRLTFSGGRDADGSPKKPLNFAFNADLERGTVEPGGQGQIRSNTLHAYFDESRIPPEDRRPIAKDTEELVLAAQPGASPLALDTVVRQFAKVYTSAALTRVADAYSLANVTKKLAHDTRLTMDETVGNIKPGQVSAPKPKESVTPAVPAKESKAKAAPLTTKGGAVDFRMETGSGRERTFVVQAASRATPQKLWEIFTGYDRLKQFVPDMLVSEREGQDGTAVIVHTVYLTRFMFFVFKINLHLRVIEQPREFTMQFERIAGEFKSFRGSLQITTDPATRESRIAFHATVVPTGRMMGWTLEKMGRRLLVPQMEAIRAKAESL